MRLSKAGPALVMPLVLALAGCSEITEFPEGGVDVRATHASPPLRNETVDFTATVAVDNFSNRTIFVEEGCGWVLERLDGSGAIDAYDAPCVGLQQLTQVEPGRTRVFTITALVAQRLDVTAGPGGIYRVRLAMEASYSAVRRQPIPDEQRTSNVFVVPD
jgi:hypothetical protein